MITAVVNRYKEPFHIDIGRNSKWGNLNKGFSLSLK